MHTTAGLVVAMPSRDDVYIYILFFFRYVLCSAHMAKVTIFKLLLLLTIMTDTKGERERERNICPSVFFKLFIFRASAVIARATFSTSPGPAPQREKKLLDAAYIKKRLARGSIIILTRLTGGFKARARAQCTYIYTAHSIARNENRVN